METAAPARKSSPWVSFAFLGLLLGAMSLVLFRDNIFATFGYHPPAATISGTPAPPFSATTLGGAEIALPDDFRGRLVLLDFWATWCPPCRAAIPELRAAQQRFGPHGLEIVSVSLDSLQNIGRADVKSFVQRQEMDWLHVYENAAMLMRQYEVQSIPALFLIDGDTREIIAAGEQLHGPYLERTLTEAFAGRSAPRAALVPHD